MIENWYIALADPRGYKFESTNPTRTIQKLYAARVKAQDPLLAKLSIVQINNQIWIIHREKSDETDPQTHPEPLSG